MGPPIFCTKTVAAFQSTGRRDPPTMGSPRPIVAHTGRSLPANAKPSAWMVDGRCACTKRRVILILAVAHTRPATASSYRAQLQPEEGTTSIGLEGQEHHPQDHARP
jgi:hypothetical protein